MKKEKVIKSTLVIVIITILSRISGFFRDALIASKFGATYLTDAYNVALTIPNIFFNIIGIAVSTAMIPILTSIYKQKGKEAVFKFTNQTIFSLLIIMIVLCLLAFAYTEEIVRVLVPNFSGDEYFLTLYLTKYSLVNILFMSLNSAYTALLQTFNKFGVPALVGFIVNLPIIVYLLFNNQANIEELMIVTVIGFGLQIIVQMPSLIKMGYRIQFHFGFKDGNFKKLLQLIFPVLIGSGVNQINTFVDRYMASYLPAGSIAAMDFATKLSTSIYAIFAYAVVTVIYPLLSSIKVQQDSQKLNEFVYKGINIINIITIPSALIMMVYSQEMITLIFKRGAFDDKAVHMTSTALTYLSVGIIFWGIRDIYNRVFYTFNDSKTPMINGIIGVFTCIVINILIVERVGIAGLAISTTVSSIVTTCLLHKSISKKLSGFENRFLLKSVFKITIASVLLIIISISLESLIFIHLFNSIIALIISICIACVCYVFILLKLEIREVSIIFEISKNKRNIAESSVS
ncbi:murein biosynthesis integral membrane protein MurJ [Bacillus sp. S14(2024)]|uniref:murein biosynthesis integral membrane protein MurJ n=1 Tax=Bacillus sp. S14(2024) TaxID=3162884 RepID=UPI003D249CBF